MSHDEVRKLPPRPSSLPPIERSSVLDTSTTSQNSAPPPPLSDGLFRPKSPEEEVLGTYKKEEFDQHIRDAFRDRQRQKQQHRQPAENAGKSIPSDAEAQMWTSFNKLKGLPGGGAKGRLDGVDHSNKLHTKKPIEPINALTEVQREVEGSIADREEELRNKCAPFTFEEVHDSLFAALISLERGDLKEKVYLPMCKEEEVEGKKTKKYVVGSENVLVFLREKMLPLVYDALPAVHATHWVAQYTINFLRSLATQTEREAQLRVELLARCVKLLGRTESFSAILLSIQSKSEEYDAFTLLRDSAQEHLSFLLDTIDEGLRAVLSCRFPHRRQRLALIERGIKAKLQRSLLFMNELDYNWAPNVKFHAEWKEAFLSRIFHRIHEDIAARFVYCTMGFIDQALYEKVKNFNTGKTQGTEVIRARLVEHEKTVEKLTFQQIGMTIKGSASIVVGLQLCLGARFILNQCTAAFDEAWGFPMHEDAEGPSDETVSKAVNVISKQAKQKANPTQTNSTRVKSTFFLTQEEEDE